MKAITLSISILALTLPTQSFAQEVEAQTANPQNTVFGVWETARVPEEGEDTIAHIKIEPCKNNPNNACGKIVWTERTIDPETGKAPLDKHNSEEHLRVRPIMCLQIMNDFEPTDTPNSYDSGEIYSTRTGKTYNGSMELKGPNRLAMRGSVLFGIIGRTTSWKRVQNPGDDPCS